MRNHVEKQRDMARSVLPSTKRDAKRSKRAQHKSVRGRVRRSLTRDHETADLVLDAQRHKRYQGIKVEVLDRRGADKLGPIMRWAEAKADDFGATPQERFAGLRAVLPPGIIGWHAMTHIEGIEAYERTRSHWRSYRLETKADRKARYAAETAQLIADLNANLDRVGELNAALKRSRVARLWHGEHDTVEFVAETRAERRTWVMPKFLDGGGFVPGYWKEARGRKVVGEFLYGPVAAMVAA